MMSVERRHDMGVGGNCICPKCEARVPHEQGVPCQEARCPGCGTKMLREGSHHYDLWKAKHALKKGG